MKVFKYNLLGLAVILLSLASCETLETAKQDVDPIVSPDGYPVATFVSGDADNIVNEGDTIIYTISINETIDRAITFNAVMAEGTLTEDDYVVVPGTLEPWTTETQLMIILLDDGVPNAAKTGKFEFEVPGIAEHYLLNPSQVYPSYDLTVKNTLLTIEMSWDGDADFDMVIWQEIAENQLVEFSDHGATTANPEAESMYSTFPVGTYYVNIMDWDGGPFDYTFTIANTDGVEQTITGTFDKDTKTYVNDAWTAWGGSYDSYRVLKLENNGTSFTVTELVD